MKPIQLNSIEEVKAYSEKEVDTLLSQYQTYKELGEEIALLEKQVLEVKPSVAKTGWLSQGTIASHDAHAEEKGKIRALKQEQEEVGIAMKFQNPIIWAMYKFKAYANDAHAIRSVSDLVRHSEGDGICGKRILYINRHLESKFGKNLTDLFDAELSIPSLTEDGKYASLPLDQKFMEEWSSQENHEEGKWHEYR